MAKANVNVNAKTGGGASGESVWTRASASFAKALATKGNPVTEAAMDAASAPISSGFVESQGYSGAGEATPLNQRIEQVRSEEGLNNKQPITTPQVSVGQNAPPVDFGLDGNDDTKYIPMDRHGVSDSLTGFVNRGENMGKALNQNDYTINWHPAKGSKGAVQEAYSTQARAARDLQENATTQADYDQARNSTLSTLDNQYNPVDGSRNVLPSVIHNLDGLILGTDGSYKIDPSFGNIISLVTENHLADTFLGTEDTTENVEGMEDPNYEEETGPMPVVNPMDTATKLGGEIEKWQTIQKRADGGPAPLRTLDENEKKALGAMALQTYQLANPDIVESRKLTNEEVIETKDDGTGTRLILTEGFGIPEFENSRSARSKLFGFNVPPLHSKPVQNELPGDLEKVKPAFKRKKSMGFIERVYEAMLNQSRVGHVVDDKRAKLLLLLVTNPLLGEANKDNTFAEVFGIGEVSVKKIIIREEAAVLKGESDGKIPPADVAKKIINNKKRKLVDELASIFSNRGVVNYLSYYAQPLTARTSPNQTNFNPTVSKIVRFVTRSAKPVTVKKGSRLEKNYLQMVSSTLLSGKFKDADGNLLLDMSSLGLQMPDGRVNSLRKYGFEKDQTLTSFRQWGKALNEAVGSYSKEHMDKVSAAVAQGIPLNHPSFPKADTNKFNEIFERDPRMKDYLLAFGEDMPLAIDTLMDFSNYIDAFQAGKPHVTTLNAYFDGKTNGIAAQGLQIGSRRIASLTGVLRAKNARFILHEENGQPQDVRDYMQTFINKRVDEGASPKAVGFSHEVNVVFTQVMKDLGSYRALNKIISMVFPYGKETSAMGAEVEEAFMDLRAENKEFDDSVRWMEAHGVRRQDIIDGAHENVVASLMDLFGEDTFKARSLMRNSAMLFAAMDDMFSITGPVGHTINMGGDKYNKNETVTNKVTVSSKEAIARIKELKGMRASSTEEAQAIEKELEHLERNKNSALVTEVSPRYGSSASSRDDSIAKVAYGQSAVTPTQSTDAGVVIKTFAGKSWDKIKKITGGDPYVYQIYDAFKVDVASYDSVLEEVNQNWYDINMNDWNFFAEAEASVKRGKAKFDKDMAGRDPRDINTLEVGSKYDYIGAILNGRTEELDGESKVTFRSLLAFSKSINPINVKDGESSYDYDVRLHDQAANIYNVMHKSLGSHGRLSAVTYTTREGIERVGFNTKNASLIPELSNHDISRVVNFMFNKSNYYNNMTTFLAKIKENKKQLRRDIERQRGQEVFGKIYQYYAK